MMFYQELKNLSTFADPQRKQQSVLICRLARLGYRIDQEAVVCTHCNESVAFKSDPLDENTIEQHKRLHPQCPCSQTNASHQLESLEEIIKEFRLNDYPKGDLASDGLNLATAPIEVLSSCYERAKGRGVFKLSQSACPVIADREDPDFDLLRSEATRLGTFYDWPTDVHVKPRDLAKAGLFYTGRIDRVRCAFCRNFLRNWAEDDMPMTEHRRHFPECWFVKNETGAGNVMIDGVDARVKQTIEGPLAGLTLRGGDLGAIVNPPLIKPPQRGPRGSTQPMHPGYVEENKRVQSFTGKTTPQGQNVSVLANAGFFYIGPNDKVMCYFCNGTLKNWTSADDPWVEHAKFFPRCGFLRSKRDPGYIQVIQDSLRISMQIPRQYSISEAGSQGNPVLIDRGAAAAGATGGPGSGSVDETMQREVEENADLWDMKTCKVCVDEEVNVVFLPCGHLACCNNCAPSLRNCPLCRALIRGTVRVFLS